MPSPSPPAGETRKSGEEKDKRGERKEKRIKRKEANSQMRNTDRVSNSILDSLRYPGVQVACN